MRLSPTKNASNPAPRSRNKSSCERNPDSLTAMHSSGTRPINSNEVSTRTSNVLRSRLFTPIILAPAPSARSISSAVCTSTSASIPIVLPSSSKSRNSSSPSTATINKKLSASFARASHTCHGSKIKSFRSTGNTTDFRASRKFFSDPRKNSLSVKTESAAAPAPASDCASPTGSNGSRKTPREGDAGFSSAITFNPSRKSAAEKSRNGVAAFTPYFSAVSGKTCLRCATSALRASSMRSSTVPVLDCALTKVSLYARCAN